MKISQAFSVSKPLPAVWALFQNIPEVATCMPGAELTGDKGGGVYAGRLGIKLGPFNAFFDGEATVTRNAADHTGHVEGKGIDKRGGSRSKLLLDYELTEQDGATHVTINADLQLSGPIAQFGRTGMINETAAVLIGQFVKNVETKLAAMDAEPEATTTHSASRPPQPAPSISAGNMLWLVIKSMFGKLLGRT